MSAGKRLFVVGELEAHLFGGVIANQQLRAVVGANFRTPKPLPPGPKLFMVSPSIRPHAVLGIVGEAGTQREGIQVIGAQSRRASGKWQYRRSTARRKYSGPEASDERRGPTER